MNLREAEFIQYLNHQRSFGQSLKTCQRCESEEFEITSVLLIKSLSSSFSSINSSSKGFVKLGHPQLLSNLSFEENKGVQSTMST
jgi:hypothetical protein